MRIDTTKVVYYKTNAGMGHGEYAYFLAINKNLLLCVDVIGSQDYYKIGHLLSDFKISEMTLFDFEPMVSPLFASGTLGVILDYLEPVTHEAIKELGWKYVAVASDGGTKIFQKAELYGLVFSGDNGLMKLRADPCFHEIEIYKVTAEKGYGVSNDGRNVYKTYTKKIQLFKGIVNSMGFLKQVIASVMPLVG